jgi:hypothetical protein
MSTYWAVGYGCVERPELDDDGPLSKIFEKRGIQLSYEGATRYAVVPLLSTITRNLDYEIPSGVMPIEDLAAAITTQIGAAGVAKAVKTWRAVRAAAMALAVPVDLPEGRLIWFCDTD